jgi:hypothetical protein
VVPGLAVIVSVGRAFRNEIENYTTSTGEWQAHPGDLHRTGVRAGGRPSPQGRQRRWQSGQNVVERASTTIRRSSVAHRGQGRPARP